MMLSVEKFIEDFNLKVIVEGDKNSVINVTDVNRPGLQFSGYYDYFANERIQIIGKAEWSFLNAMQLEIRKKRVRKFFSFETPCIVITRELEPHEEVVENAKINNRWLLGTDMLSTRFISKLTNYLEDKLAPETRLHGVLVDVYGIGILITGESGIGKSETALELIKRGHRLVADDAVDIREIDGILKGSSPFITAGMIEVRGMGIIDVPALYGLSSILDTKTIHLVIYLDHWDQTANYDRLGVDKQYIDILNVPIRKITLPIRPGRNLAVIIEAAAANYRYSLMSDVTPADTIDRRIESMANNER